MKVNEYCYFIIVIRRAVSLVALAVIIFVLLVARWWTEGFPRAGQRLGAGAGVPTIFEVIIANPLGRLLVSTAFVSTAG